MVRLSVAFAILFILYGSLLGQNVPYPITNQGIYNYLDELGSLGVIDINSVVKPYSRLYISEKLKEAENKREELSSRQQKELDFYLMDIGKEFNSGRDWDRRKDMFYYKDDLFTLTVNPILGGEFNTNAYGSATYWRNGVAAWSYIGKWSFYASLRDNHEKPLLASPDYLTQRDGGHVKNGTDWSEMKGGVTYGWEWGSAGLVKDNMIWGSNSNGSNIFSGHTPTFFQIRLHLNPTDWFEFNYFHGSLNSMVVDSARSYTVNNSYGTDYREVYHRKYIAANMFSFRPIKGLWLSAGNSVIYSDYGFNPVYLIPVMFYKSVDHSVNSGIDNMNSQMFFDISSRRIKHLYVYGTLFIDELSVSRFSKPDEYNFFSYKAGVSLTDYPLSNLTLRGEFTYTYPLAFQHYVPTLTFESNRYNLGHYLKDNSREWFFALDYRPVRGSLISLFFSDATRGPDYTELGVDRLGNPPLESVDWHNRTIGLKAQYQVIHDLYLSFSFIHSNISGNPDWTAPYFYGKTSTVSVGATMGF
jgi:hypothetical protein